MFIVKASIKNVHAIAVLALLIGVLGSVAILSIPVDILPAFKAPAVQVMTYYSGMPTGSVERTITNRVERWTNQAVGCQTVESRSTLGVSVIRLNFREDIDPNGALTQVNSLALGTLPTLPPGTLPPVVMPFDPTATLPLCILTLTSPDLSETELKDTGRIDIRNMLGGVKGVVAPAVFGGKDRTVLIYVDPRKLQARNLSPMDVVDALQKANLMVTPGVAKFGTYEYQLDSNAMVESVAELNEIPIKTTRGNRVFLKDIGYAVDGNSIQTAMVRINGRRQVYVPIYRQQGASSLAVVDGVKNNLGRMTDSLKSNDKDVKLNVVMDQSEYVRAAIEALIHEGIIGAVLVAVMILLFLGEWRMTVIATLSIPLAVLCSIVGLVATGNTINAMTLGGLALAIGPLVDNAIVVLENTHRHQMLGKTPIQAAYAGASEVTIPVLIATICTIIVLCPIALMPGMGGFLFRPLTLALAFAMVASFILSQTLVPGLCSRWLVHHTHHGVAAPKGWLTRILGIVDVILGWMTRRYATILDLALRRRWSVLTVVTIAFFASMLFLLGIGQEFFPAVDAGQITMQIRATSGTNLEESERRIKEVEEFLQKNIPQHDRHMIVAELGLVPDWSAAYTANAGTQDTVIKIQLSDHRKKSSQQYASELRKRFLADHRFDDLRVSFDTGGMVSAALNQGASSPLDIRISGGTLNDAMALAQRVREQVARVPGAVDVRVMQRLDAQQRVIEVDRVKAADVGLDMASVIKQVATAMNSSVSISRNFWIDARSGNQYFVAVQYPEDPQRKMEDVLNIPATGTNASHPVKLDTLVSIRPATAAVEVNHVDLARVFNVMVNLDGKDVGSVARKVNRKLRNIQNELWAKEKESVPKDGDDGAIVYPKALRIKVSGEYQRMVESFSSLGFGLVLASVLIYLLLVAMLRSFLGPMVIMFAVPLGLIGVLGMLFLTRTTLNVQSSMGVIFMVGIVVANSVLLVDFANKQRTDGLDATEAIKRAALTRFKPILMTFLATFLDLLPMALALGKGSEANAPLARAVIGGLLSSTFLTLIVVPIMYTLLLKNQANRDAEIDSQIADIHTVGHAPDAHAVAPA